MPLRLPKSNAAPVEPPGSDAKGTNADNNVLDSSFSIISAPTSWPPGRPTSTVLFLQIALWPSPLDVAAAIALQTNSLPHFYYLSCFADYCAKSCYITRSGSAAG